MLTYCNVCGIGLISDEEDDTCEDCLNWSYNIKLKENSRSLMAMGNFLMAQELIRRIYGAN